MSTESPPRLLVHLVWAGIALATVWLGFREFAWTYHTNKPLFRVHRMNGTIERYDTKRHEWVKLEQWADYQRGMTALEADDALPR
jgi:hypothetical protein